jgi:hypothetical protein
VTGRRFDTSAILLSDLLQTYPVAVLVIDEGDPG